MPAFKKADSIFPLKILFLLELIAVTTATAVGVDSDLFPYSNDDFDMYITVPYVLLNKYHLMPTTAAATTLPLGHIYMNTGNSNNDNRLVNIKRMNINSNANIQIPMELAKEMGLLKNLASGFCKDNSGPAATQLQQQNPSLVRKLCGNVDSKAGVNSDMNPQLPGFPVFSIGGQQPATGTGPPEDVMTINLKGKDGKRGKTGPKGPPGDRGPQGPQGQQGEKGDKGENCLAENLIRQSKCDSEKIQRIKERLDRIESECAKNASLLASITLSVVTSLTQARPPKDDNPLQKQIETAKNLTNSFKVPLLNGQKRSFIHHRLPRLTSPGIRPTVVVQKVHHKLSNLIPPIENQYTSSVIQNQN